MKALAVVVACALAIAWGVSAQGVSPGIDDATAAPPTIRFEYAFYAVPADFPYLWVSAYRVGNLKGRATAAWTTADSSAVSGVDYRQSTGELSWADGVGGAQQLYVPLIPRRTGPYDRTFTVLLHDQTGAALGFPSAAVVTISQPSVWQLWADTSTAGAGVDPFAVPNGSTGSVVTTTNANANPNQNQNPNQNPNPNSPSPSDGAVNPASANPNPNANANANPNPSVSGSGNGAGSAGGSGTSTTGGSTITASGAPMAGGGGSSSGTDPAIDPVPGAGAGAGNAAGGSGSSSGSATNPQSGSGDGSGTGATASPTNPNTNPSASSGAPNTVTGTTGATNAPTNPLGTATTTGSDSGSGETGSVTPQQSGTATGSGSGSQQTPSQSSPGGSTSGQPQQPQPTGSAAGSNQPVQPSGLTGSSQPQSSGGGGNTQASTGILSQFASAFAWDSSAYQTDNSNNFVVVGVSRLQVLPLGLQPCSVRYTTVDGTGRAGVDYTATSGVLEYAANDFAPRAIFVPIRQGDANSPPAGVKVFAIRLTDPVNAFLGMPSSAPISVSAVPFSEGKVVLTSDAYATPVQAGSAVATVQRLIGKSGAVNVSYSTTDGTAKAGTDYTATTGLLSWSDGDMSPRNITVPLISSSPTVKALPDTGTVAGAPNFFLSLALGADSKGFLGGPRTAAMFITNLSPRSGAGSGTGTGTGPGTTQTNVSGGTGTGTGGVIGTGTGAGGHTASSSTGSGGTGSGVKPNASSTGSNKPPTASSTGTRVPPVVIPPPTTATGTATGGTNTTTTDERSAAASVRGLAPAALLTVLLSALWLAA